MTAPVVSVVTPFYNTAAYLDACIASVRAQTRSDFEYVLVDNCSTDGSSEIAKRHAQADPRIRVTRNERFLTQVQNYNHALAQIAPATRYVKVVQADDMLFPRCLEDMVGLAAAHPRVALVSSYFLYGRTVDGDGLPLERTVLSGRDACRLHLIDGIFLFGSPTTQMFRADIVRGRTPFWAEGRLHEDTEAVFEILRDHDFGFVHQVLSFSRVDSASIMGSISDFGSARLDKLIILERFGRDFLSPGEFDQYATDFRERYRRFLAEAWLDRRETAFWEFHRKGLATIGADIEPLAIARHAVPALVDSLLAPRLVAVLRRVKRAIGRRS